MVNNYFRYSSSRFYLNAFSVRSTPSTKYLFIFLMPTFLLVLGQG